MNANMERGITPQSSSGEWSSTHRLQEPGPDRKDHTNVLREYASALHPEDRERPHHKFPQSTNDVQTSNFDGDTRIPLSFETSHARIPHYRDSYQKEMRLFLLSSSSSASRNVTTKAAFPIFFVFLPRISFTTACIARRSGPLREVVAGYIPMATRAIGKEYCGFSID